MEILRTRSESIAMLKTEVHHLGRQILQVSLGCNDIDRRYSYDLKIHTICVKERLPLTRLVRLMHCRHGMAQMLYLLALVRMPGIEGGLGML